MIRHIRADLRSSVSAKQVMELVDMSKFEEIQARYRTAGEAKFLDWRRKHRCPWQRTMLRWLTPMARKAPVPPED